MLRSTRARLMRFRSWEEARARRGIPARCTGKRGWGVEVSWRGEVSDLYVWWADRAEYRDGGAAEERGWRVRNGEGGSCGSLGRLGCWKIVDGKIMMCTPAFDVSGSTRRTMRAFTRNGRIAIRISTVRLEAQGPSDMEANSKPNSRSRTYISTTPSLI
nr:hypothetical protein CFP56_65168 [Quercus suber]